MSLPRPIQWYHVQANLIWLDCSFKALRGHWILDPLTSLNLVPNWQMKARKENIILPIIKKVSSYSILAQSPNLPK
jgi:hypothetical protein